MANSRDRILGFSTAVISGAALPTFLWGEAVNHEPIPVVPGGIIVGLGSLVLGALSYSVLANETKETRLDN